MTEEAQKVPRILHLRMKLPSADAAQLLSFVKAASFFYQTMGATRFRLLRNVDDPTQLVQVLEYETQGALELNRHRIASDPAVRGFLQTWRTLLMGAIEIDVYEDVTGSIG